MVVSNGDHGIILDGGSDNNKIYHNKFISNSPQAFNGGAGNSWDDGYPSGGNYWSDFDSPGEGAYDDYHGPNQNISGSDDIVDQGTGGGGGKNPYNVPGGSQDTYPFIFLVNLPPAAPIDLNAIAGDSFVNLTWSGPYDNGGSPVTSYNIYRNDTPGILISVPATQLWYNDTNVLNGVKYIYNVSAVNSIGEGPNSTDVNATPTAVPSAPINLMVMFGDTFINLTWDKPLTQGGSPIIIYNIHRDDITGVLATVPADQLWYNDTLVVNGQVYIYNISAENSVGEGPCSIDISASPMTTPSAPLDLEATAGDSSVHLTWDSPIDEGGSVITGFNIYREDQPGVYDSIPATRLWYDDTDVENGNTYTYYVSAENIMGEGPYSNEISATPMTTPSAPENLQGIAGSNYVFLTWDYPSTDGGSEITNYVIYRVGTNNVYISLPSDQLWYNDTEVSNSNTYEYIVRAVNIVGEGSDSNVVTANPMMTPSAPLDFQEASGDGYVYLSWSRPFDDGGSPITGYNIYRNDTADVHVSVSATQLWYNDTDVINGLTYTYRVSAENIEGEGSLSIEVSAVPMTVPSAPGNLICNEGNGYANLTWTIPSSDGGSAIIGYNIYRNDWSGRYMGISADQIWYNDTDVINGLTYTYTITAINHVGKSPNSNSAPAAPTTVPQAPLNLRITTGDGVVILTWEPPTSDGGSPVINYRIHRYTASGSETLVMGVGNVNYYEDTDVKTGTTYTYTVTAENSVGEGLQSNEADAQLPEEEEEYPWWFWILIAIIIGLIVTLFIMIFKSRKREEPQTFQEPPPPEEETIQPDLSSPEQERPPPPPPPPHTDD
jgi:fibronectin type 3 domain-containing protein